MPAYNAEKTISEVWNKIPERYKKQTFLVDDNSRDKTYEVAKKLGIECYKNKQNLGYGGNIKVCLKMALEKGGDILIEMHPDNEYDPASIEAAIEKITKETGMILGNRTQAVETGMYIWKYIPSKILTITDNLILGTHLADLHQGFRVYTRQMLEKIDFNSNSTNYLFSFEIIAQTIFYGFTIDEVAVKTNYSGKKRGASLKNSIIYTLETYRVLFFFIIARLGIRIGIFK